MPQKGAILDDIVGANDSTAELEGEPVFLTFSYHHAAGSKKEVPEPMFLAYNFMVQTEKGNNIVVMTGDS